MADPLEDRFCFCLRDDPCIGSTAQRPPIPRLQHPSARLLVLFVFLLSGSLPSLRALELPVGSAPEPVAYPWFPDRAHAVVFRNWQLVDPSRLAQVLGTDLRNVEVLAESMGLPPAGDAWKRLDRRAYITILRRNWHLLPYEQILELLAMSEERLRFSLQEDDFLFIKLGRLKPACDVVRYRPPDGATKPRLETMRRLVGQHFRERFEGTWERRFAFVEDLARVPADAPPSQPGIPGPAESLRFVYSYFGAFGDPLLDSDQDPFPEGLLRRLRAQGVNGVWLHIVLRQLAPGGPEFPEFGKGSEQRLTRLRELVARAKARGLGVYLYLNEPRSQPLAFFAAEGREALRGVVAGDHATMCTSDARVRGWLRDALAHVFREVPELGGVFTISASENLTNCSSHFSKDRCPRCRSRSDAEILGELHRAVLAGVRQSSKTARVIAWDWGWNRHGESPEIIESLPAGLTLQSVSEWSLPLERGGVEVSVGEYCLSEPGPGPRARKQWAAARARGLRTAAKLQLGTTWELGSLPFLPVLDLVAEHLAALAELRIDDQMLGWTLGGYPSPNLQVAAFFHADPTTNADAVLDRVAKGRYGEAAVGAARRAWTAFSKAFRQFPYDGRVLYNGPQHRGAANRLWLEPTGYSATMVGLPYDDIDGWRGAYPREVLAGQFERLAEAWAPGLKALEEVVETVRRTRPEFLTRVEGDLRIARAARVQFASSATQCRFVIARDHLRGLDPKSLPAKRRREELRQLLRREIDHACEQFSLSRSDARLGFEASNHYFYMPLDLVEKVLNCEYILAELDREPGGR